MDERDIIERMNRNQIAMHRIDVLFLVSGILCVIINGFVALCEALLLPAHLGNFSEFSFFSLIESLIAIGSVPLSVLSSCKKEGWTAAALAAFLARVILIMIIYQSFMAGMPILLLFALPQYLCLRKYPALDYLKGQFGYPGFNAEIYMQTQPPHIRGRICRKNEAGKDRSRQHTNGRYQTSSDAGRL